MVTSNPQTIGTLLRRTLAFYRTHLRVIMAVTIPVTVFVDVMIAIGLGGLTASYRHAQPRGHAYIALAATELVTIPLITSMLARLVLAVSRDERRSAREVAAEGLELFGVVLVVVLCYWGAVLAGLVVFVVPALYFAISWYFGVLGVVIAGESPIAALRSSAALVRGRWLRCISTGLAFQISVALAQAAAVVVFDALAKTADSDVLLVLGNVVVDCVTVPFIAIGSTLFYLALRAEPPAARAF